PFGRGPAPVGRSRPLQGCARVLRVSFGGSRVYRENEPRSRAIPLRARPKHKLRGSLHRVLGEVLAAELEIDDAVLYRRRVALARAADEVALEPVRTPVRMRRDDDLVRREQLERV